MFRLYNAAFARFPDIDGLSYWIQNYSSLNNNFEGIAASFLASDEFKKSYGEKTSNEEYINNLYKNVLGRKADNDGLDYWIGQLVTGTETREEILLGFSESFENKILFTEMTGFG